MGCKKITYQNFSFLEVVHRKKATEKFIFGLNGDHLGNIRLSYQDADNNGTIDASSEIISEKNYYPFGLQHRGYNYVNSALGNSVAKKFKYQGQELNESLGYNMYEFELRHYDASIGRFVTTDPYEQFMSPYVAMGNNPIVSFDPDGGYCYDSNGNQIACPDDAGDFYDDYKDSETNHIDILDEVVVTEKSKETKANEAYWKEINKSAEILDKLATLETGQTSAERNKEEPDPLANLVTLYPVKIEPIGGAGALELIGAPITKAPQFIAFLTKLWKSGNLAKKAVSASEAAGKLGGVYVKYFKRVSKVGTKVGRSRGHGAPHKRAGNELIKLANDKSAGWSAEFSAALKKEGNRLINQGKGHSHK